MTTFIKISEDEFREDAFGSYTDIEIEEIVVNGNTYSRKICNKINYTYSELFEETYEDGKKKWFGYLEMDLTIFNLPVFKVWYCNKFTSTLYPCNFSANFFANFWMNFFTEFPINHFHFSLGKKTQSINNFLISSDVYYPLFDYPQNNYMFISFKFYNIFKYDFKNILTLCLNKEKINGLFEIIKKDTEINRNKMFIEFLNQKILQKQKRLLNYY